MHPGVVDALTVRELGEIEFRGVDASEQPATRVPTLQAAIESLQSRTRLFAELKIGPGANAQQVGQAAANIYLEASPGKSADIMSFAAAAIDAYREHASANTVLLLPEVIDTTSTRAREQALADARACGSTTIGLRDDLITAGFVAYAHRWDIAVLTWPNADLTAARRGIHAGVDIVVTDSPDALIKRLAPLARS
jgi:glycerophosphoryl diester phosphodiesterase